jgi:hypothetical protein
MTLSLPQSNFLLLGGLLLLASSCVSSRAIRLDSPAVRVVNRSLVPPDEDHPRTLTLDARSGNGLAIIPDLNFKQGTIELELRGEDKPGASFVGLAFNIQNDSTYEAVYFRPFNFQSPEAGRRTHGMQYIFHPTYTWRKLRTEREGEFEAEYPNPPDPNDWVKVQLTVLPQRVRVTDPASGAILLEVPRLDNSTSGQIGFWVGEGSQGSIRNLRMLSR